MLTLDGRAAQKSVVSRVVRRDNTYESVRPESASVSCGAPPPIVNYRDGGSGRSLTPPPTVLRIYLNVILICPPALTAAFGAHCRVRARPVFAVKLCDVM